MKTFAAMAPGEERNRTVGFVNQLQPGDVISSVSVVASYYETSGVTSPDPSGVLVGDPSLNTLAVTVQGVINPPGTAVIQKIGNLTAKAVYILRFALNLSDGRVYYEDVIQPVAAYVPPAP